VTPCKTKKGWYTHWIAVERDITDQKIRELENALLAQISVDFKVEITLQQMSYVNQLVKLEILTL
jgi:hypothetical protein